jgi:HEPN domain-containing protein
MTTSEEKKVYDSKTALACGEAFQRLAIGLIPRICEIKNDPEYEISKEISDVIACATNLTFAIELFLKALLIQLGLPVPISHDLLKLYNKIPKTVRTIIEDVYNTKFPEQLHRLRKHSITLAIGPKEKFQEEPQWGDYKASTLLPKLLERSRNLFQSWRYYFEFRQPEDSYYQFHEFEYGLLWCAAEAIRVEVIVRLRGIVNTQENQQ